MLKKEFNQENLHITVVGGGNIGTQFACVCASKGYDVTMWCSRPEAFSKDLVIVNENEQITSGTLHAVTDSPETAVKNCDFMFVTYPAFMLRSLAETILPYVHEGLYICVIPGTGGAEFAFQECIKKGAVLCGLQRVPAVARLEEYGKRVRCEGLRDRLFIGSVPSAYAEDLSEFMSYLWGIPCSALPNYLNVTLTPSNPILHTTRLRTLFRDYTAEKVYDRNPLFYGEWSDDSSELMMACDEELQNMCRKLDQMDLANVRSLKLHYESDTVPAMTAKIRSIKSLHNLNSPMIQTEEGWLPDFKSRYFTADFPYGLAILEELADILGEEAPNIRSTMNWYRQVTGDCSRLNLQDYGIHTKEDLYDFYD